MSAVTLDGRSVPSHKLSDPEMQRQPCVLLIEDNKDAMRVVKYALEKQGRGQYQLEWASSLRDGLSRLDEGGIDLVVLDLGLPDCSGSTSYSWIQKVAPDVPIVILTGDVTGEAKAAAAGGGIADYLIKGRATGTILVSAITQALERRSRQTSEEKYYLL
jgi:DNA-binding response OmpR family regulator